MTNINVFKYWAAVLLLVANVNIHGATLTAAAEIKLQQQLDAVRKSMVEASKEAKSATFDDKMTALVNHQNTIKRKLAGR